MDAQLDTWLAIMSQADKASVVGLESESGPNAATARKLLAMLETAESGSNAATVRKLLAALETAEVGTSTATARKLLAALETAEKVTGLHAGVSRK